jgi:hypothetical protein
MKLNFLDNAIHNWHKCGIDAMIPCVQNWGEHASCPRIVVVVKHCPGTEFIGECDTYAEARRLVATIKGYITRKWNQLDKAKAA